MKKKSFAGTLLKNIFFMNLMLMVLRHGLASIIVLLASQGVITVTNAEAECLISVFSVVTSIIGNIACIPITFRDVG